MWLLWAVRAGVKAQRDRRDIFDGFRINLGFQIQGEPRPGFALVSCHLRLQRTGDGDRGDNQEDCHHDQSARLTNWTWNPSCGKQLGMVFAKVAVSSVQINYATIPFTEKENPNAIRYCWSGKLRQHRSLLRGPRLG